MAIHTRWLAFRYLLPALNITAHLAVLYVAAQPPHSNSFGYDPLETLAHKIIRLADGPAYSLALTLREALSIQGAQFVDWCAGLAGTLLWYGIGYWADCELGVLPKPASRRPVCFCAGFLLSALTLAVAAIWAYIGVYQRPFVRSVFEQHPSELVSQLVAWPMLLSVILLRIMAHNRRAKAPGLPQGGMPAQAG